MLSVYFTVVVLEEIHVQNVIEKEIGVERETGREKENVKDKLHLPLHLAVAYKVHICNASSMHTYIKFII